MAKFTQPQAKLQDVLSDPTLDVVMERYGLNWDVATDGRKADLVAFGFQEVGRAGRLVQIRAHSDSHEAPLNILGLRFGAKLNQNCGRY